MKKLNTTKIETRKSILINKNGRLVVVVNTGLGPVQDYREIEEYLEDQYWSSNTLDEFLA